MHPNYNLGDRTIPKYEESAIAIIRLATLEHISIPDDSAFRLNPKIGEMAIAYPIGVVREQLHVWKVVK
ncbi:MAG: hypothetical protein F6K19_48035 [Cyanothece sp. SIO1E1]|nr:hypothetical protein [Cyanothece sp. SIO1E1]